MNGSDCGIYLILAVLHLVSQIKIGISLDESIASLSRSISADKAIAYRHELVSDIKKLLENRND